LSRAHEGSGTAVPADRSRETPSGLARSTSASRRLAITGSTGFRFLPMPPSLPGRDLEQPAWTSSGRGRPETAEVLGVMKSTLDGSVTVTKGLNRLPEDARQEIERTRLERQSAGQSTSSLRLRPHLLRDGAPLVEDRHSGGPLGHDAESDARATITVTHDEFDGASGGRDDLNSKRAPPWVLH